MPTLCSESCLRCKPLDLPDKSARRGYHGQESKVRGAEVPGLALNKVVPPRAMQCRHSIQAPLCLLGLWGPWELAGQKLGATISGGTPLRPLPHSTCSGLPDMTRS